MSQNSTKKFGFTLIELLVVISIIALLLGILVPVLGKAKRSANLMKESTSTRNVGLALNVFASSNKDWFPGLNSSGQYAATGATGAFIGKYYAAPSNGTGASASSSAATSLSVLTNYAQAISLDEGGTNPAQWISANETNQSVVNTTAAIGPAVAAVPGPPTVAANSVTSNNNSFAVLDYGISTLKSEWKSVQNQQAVILGSRVVNIAAAAGTTTLSGFNTTWTDQGSGKFQGATTRGDNSTSLDVYSTVADLQTSYGTLKFGSIAAQAGFTPATAVGVYGVTTASGDDTSKFDNAQATGSYTKGQIGSANN